MKEASYCGDFGTIRIKGMFSELLSKHAYLKNGKRCRKKCLACKAENQLNDLATTIFQSGGLLTAVDTECEFERNMPLKKVKLPPIPDDYEQAPPRAATPAG